MKTYKPIILRVCLLMAIALMLPTSALARQITSTSTVQKGQVLDQNMILTGTAVTMDGVINGDLLAIGDTVTINGEVKGSLIVAGKNVVLNGPVSGSVYAAGLSLVLAPQANVERDVYFVGNRIETQEGSAINRDLNAVSLEAALNGSVARDVNAQVGALNLIQKAYQFAITQGWFQPNQGLNKWLAPSGYENPPLTAVVSERSSLQNIAFVSHAAERKLTANRGMNAHPSQSTDASSVSPWKAWAIAFLRNLAGLLILGLLAVWLAPAQLNLAGEQARTSPGRAFLTGLLVLVIGWFAAVITGVVVLAVTIFLYWLSLPNLAFLLGSLGLISLGLAIVIFWLSIVYFSKIIIATLSGKLLFQRFLPKYAHSRVWPFVVGVVIYALLASIPYLGWVVALVTTLFGLGALWMIAGPVSTSKQEATVEPQPVSNPLEVSAGSEG
jgi:hypothetical protein